MVSVTRSVDQLVLIGQDIFVGPTDIDDKTTRVIARGRMLGGPNDGGTFQTAHELSRGQSFSIGPCVIVTLLEIKDQQVRLGIPRAAPPGRVPQGNGQQDQGN
jgi:sRNA-binding carbon storage regulator CsrA